MTITDDLKVGGIYSFKLTSGEELIAKVAAIGTSAISVTEPASVAPGMDGKLGLVPSVFTGQPNEKVSININSITMIATTEEKTKASYVQATSKIVMPEKKIIMG